MNLLALDTATAISTVCVARSDGQRFERTSAPPDGDPPAHQRELMAAIAAAMDAAGLEFRELDAIAVGVGPGGFTGLRIGIATARGLAQAHGTPMRPVSSLAGLAARIEHPLALPLIDARRGEVFAALYEGSVDRWAPHAASAADLGARLQAEGLAPLAAGDGALRYRDKLEAAGVEVAGEGSAAHAISAAAVCDLAADVPDTPVDAVEPEYVRAADVRDNS